MRNLLIALAGTILLAGLCGCQSDPYTFATPGTVNSVIQTISPAVVRVDIAQATWRQGKQSYQRGNGSGVIIDQQGRILTNYHVAGRAVDIYVTLANKERIPAHLIGDDHWTDLAIIQMDMDEIARRKILFSSAQLGDSSKVVVGEDVMAFGTPFGLARTVTRGSVSNTDRTLYDPNDPNSRLDIDGYETGDFSNWIQMDVPINPGNSGGPLVDMNARIVGINTRGGGQNLNFAIPIDTAKPVIAAILVTAKPGEKGHVDRSDLGFQLKPMHQLEQFYDIDLNRGVLVDSVDSIGAYHDAGGKPQDILMAVNGVPTNVRFPEELAPVQSRIAQLPLDKDVTLTIRRGKQTLTLMARPTLLQGYLGEERGFNQWGVSMREVTRPYAVAHQMDDVGGVWISSIANGLPVQQSEAGLQIEDVIRKVNMQPIQTIEDFQKMYDKSVKDGDAQVLIQVVRGRQTLDAVLEVKKYAPASQPGS